MTGLQMAFTAVFVFSPAPLCWPWAQKCRLLAVGRRTSGGKLVGNIGTWPPTLDGLEGIKKPAPDCSKGGRWWHQDFLAVSQITINGRRIINRIIKRGSPPPHKRNHQGKTRCWRMRQKLASRGQFCLRLPVLHSLRRGPPFSEVRRSACYIRAARPCMRPAVRR